MSKRVERLKDSMLKVRIKRWVWCQYCQRTIFTGEQAYKIKGMKYYVCKECVEGGETNERKDAEVCGCKRDKGDV